MKKTNLRKLVAGASAVAMATGMAATMGMGAASAESMSSGEISGNAATFTRTVSGETLVDKTVTVGDEIQITNTINRKLGWLVYWAQDNHPNCIEAVPNTSLWTVGGNTYSNSGLEDGSSQKPDEASSGDGWAKIDASGNNSWAATPLVWTQTYTVTCAPGELNTGGLAWNSTGGGDDKADVGPTLTVKPKPIVPGPGDGNGDGNGDNENGGGTGSTGSLGSLGNLFGSLQLS